MEMTEKTEKTYTQADFDAAIQKWQNDFYSEAGIPETSKAADYVKSLAENHKKASAELDKLRTGDLAKYEKKVNELDKKAKEYEAQYNALKNEHTAFRIKSDIAEKLPSLDTLPETIRPVVKNQIIADLMQKAKIGDDGAISYEEPIAELIAKHPIIESVAKNITTPPAAAKEPGKIEIKEQTSQLDQWQKAFDEGLAVAASKRLYGANANNFANEYATEKGFQRPQ